MLILRNFAAGGAHANAASGDKREVFGCWKGGMLMLLTTTRKGATHLLAQLLWRIRVAA